MRTPRWFPSRFTPAIWWAVAALAAVLLGMVARSPMIPAGIGRVAPRIPAPAADLRTLLSMLGIGSTVWYAAALSAPFLAWGATRLEPDRLGWPKTIAVAAAALGGLAIITCAVQWLFDYHGLTVRPSLATYLAVLAPGQLLPWSALGGLIAIGEGRRRTVRASVERERLRAQLAEQTLITLTAQLQPHFLFNTLQGVSTLIHRDPEAADELLAKLADLLREILRHRDRVMVPLRDELRFARTYLEISALRFGDRVRFAIEVPAELEDWSVPLFILQPLIENAVSHGIGGSLEGGRVVVRGRADSDWLVLEVIDDGVGVPSHREPIEGLGLSNTRERLRAMYGDRFQLAITPGAGGGVIARIAIPVR